MKKYAGDYRRFLTDISSPEVFVRDQWQFQMHARALDHVGTENLYFVTDGLDRETLGRLAVNGVVADSGGVESAVRDTLKRVCRPGMKVAAFPEGPYCAPVEA
jgi:hypothetical protein